MSRPPGFALEGEVSLAELRVLSMTLHEWSRRHKDPAMAKEWKGVARLLDRSRAILAGSLMSRDESGTKWGRCLSAARVHAKKERGSNKPTARVASRSGMAKLSAEDEEWRRRAIESGEYGAES